MVENDLLNAKKRDHKIYITDVAIEKVPFIRYQGLDDTKNAELFELTKKVLQISQMENNSNEVAITCTLENEVLTDVIGISLGDEHSVDVCSDTVSNHLIVSGHKCAVVIMHNHPSTQTLSLEDIHFFLKYAAIKLIIVVTNQGKVHYLCKDKAYSYLNARALYNECIDGLTKNSSTKEVYMAGLTFLAHCSEAGLFYS